MKSVARAIQRKKMRDFALEKSHPVTDINDKEAKTASFMAVWFNFSLIFFYIHSKEHLSTTTKNTSLNCVEKYTQKHLFLLALGLVYRIIITQLSYLNHPKML